LYSMPCLRHTNLWCPNQTILFCSNCANMLHTPHLWLCTLRLCAVCVCVCVFGIVCMCVCVYMCVCVRVWCVCCSSHRLARCGGGARGYLRRTLLPRSSSSPDTASSPAHSWSRNSLPSPAPPPSAATSPGHPGHLQEGGRETRESKCLTGR
jgi:hypothetical protein